MCVHIITNNQNSVDISYPRLKTLGASIDSISQLVFGNFETGKYHQNIAKKIAREIIEGRLNIGEIRGVLNTEMFSLVRDALHIEIEK